MRGVESGMRVRSARQSHRTWRRAPLALVCAVAAAAVVAGCGESSSEGAAGGGGVPTGSWDQVLAAAKDEGVVNIGLHAGPGYEKFLAYANDELQKQFGIKVTGSTQSVDQWCNRVLAEQAVGQFEWDVQAGPGGNVYSVLQPAGALEEMPPWLERIPPENKADSAWAGGFELWTDPATKTSFIHHVDLRHTTYVNRDLVPADKLSGPDDMQDLLAPELKGKIAVEDPRIIGNSSNQMTWFLGKERADQYGEEFVRKLMQQVTVVNDRETLARDFVQGRYPVALGADQDMVAEFMEQGLGGEKIERLDFIGNTGSRTISILKSPPHPNATLVFLNWMLSKQGQDAWARLSLENAANSRRKDVKVYSPDTTPDYSKLEEYEPILGTKEGQVTSDQVIAIAKQTVGD
jgi:ABC-type Fe3+ transport system substrate-binding protein